MSDGDEDYAADVLSFVLCDSVRVDPVTQRCDAYGLFDTVFIHEESFAAPQLAAVVEVRNLPDGAELEVRFVEVGGETWSWGRYIHQAVPGGKTGIVRRWFGAMHVNFFPATEYRLELWQDDQRIAQRPIGVQHIV